MHAPYGGGRRRGGCGLEYGSRTDGRRGLPTVAVFVFTAEEGGYVVLHSHFPIRCRIDWRVIAVELRHDLERTAYQMARAVGETLRAGCCDVDCGRGTTASTRERGVAGNSQVYRRGQTKGVAGFVSLSMVVERRLLDGKSFSTALFGVPPLHCKHPLMSNKGRIHVSNSSLLYHPLLLLMLARVRQEATFETCSMRHSTDIPQFDWQRRHDLVTTNPEVIFRITPNQSFVCCRSSYNCHAVSHHSLLARWVARSPRRW